MDRIIAIEEGIARSSQAISAGRTRRGGATARLIAGGGERLVLLEEVESLLASKAFVVDACRHAVRDAHTVVSLAKRPVLFALARALGERSWEMWRGAVSGLESDGGGQFFCGGGSSGKVRAVRARPLG